MLDKTVSVLIPAYNEEKRIKATILALQDITEINEIIVINDGSQDQTAELVNEMGVKLINLPTNQGKGTALNRGLKEAKGEVIGLIDADLGTTASELTKLLKPILQQNLDLSIAKFPPPDKKGGFGLVTNLANLGLKLITGLTFDSPLSGQRVLTKEVIDYLDGFEEGFAVEIDMTIKTVKAGFKVKEIPVNMTHQETGRNWSGFKHRGQQFKDVLTILWDQFSPIRGEN